MAIMDIQVSPRRTGTISVSAAVVSVHKLIQQRGFVHQLHPMGTCIEGEASALYGLAAEIHQLLADQGYERIGIVIKVDDRRDKPQTMQQKLDRVTGRI
jgi:uncharacterized protein (TIGR00106 family)